MNSIMKHPHRMVPLIGGMILSNRDTNQATPQLESNYKFGVENEKSIFPVFNLSLARCERKMTKGRNFIADAAERSLPSVVQIEVETEANEIGSGSGFLLEKSTVSGVEDHSGLVVVTNAHVVLTPKEFHSEKNTIQDRTVKIRSFTGVVIDAKVVSFDKRLDLAILEIEENTYLKGADVSLANVRHGEFVVALGSPLSFENSVTAGIVSNPKREWDDVYYIQSDASTHVGNSGGPIVDVDGKVIGITSLKIADGVSFAIPIKDAICTLRKLMQQAQIK